VAYAQGGGGVHATQYQENEYKNGLNPTGYYLVQFEAKDKTTNSSPRQPNPKKIPATEFQSKVMAFTIIFL